LLALGGIVDPEKEKTRLLARAGKVRQELNKARGKLANEAFVARAPVEIVEEERRRVAVAEAALEDLERQYRERVGEELPV
jgi:valyl-tRNA synthetase